MRRLLAAMVCIFSAAALFAQTTTPNLGLALPSYASQNWNIPVNENFSKVDSAIGQLQVPYLGSWANTTVYARGNQVTYNGSLYISLINANFNNTPSSPSPAWQLAPNTGGGSANFAPNALQYATSTSASRAATSADLGALQFGVDSGTANAYAVTVGPAPTVAANTTLMFLPGNANTGAQPTLAVNGGTAYVIVADGNKTLEPGDLNTQTYASVYWNGMLSTWVLANPAVTNHVAESAETKSAGAYFFGDSVTYAGTTATGCPTTGNVPGGVPAANCNQEGPLIVAAYGGLGRAFPRSIPGYTDAAYSTGAMLDIADMEIYPYTDSGDSGAPDYFIQGSESDAIYATCISCLGTITNHQATYQGALTAAVAWLGTPHYARLYASNSTQCAVTGTWTADNSFHSGVAMQTTGTATMTCTTPYAISSAVVGVWKVSSGSTASATLTIDGVSTDTWSAGAAGTISTAPGNTSMWWGAAYPLSSTAATHTFVVNVTAASPTYPFTVAFFASPEPQQNWLGLVYPRVFVGGTENYTSTWNVFDTYTQSTVNTLSGYGWNVTYVSIYNAWPDATIPYAGGTYPNGRVCPVSTVPGSPHPGDCGHLFNSWAFLKAAGKTPLGNGVASFNGRVGAVVSQSGDYTAAQVTNAADTTAANTFTGGVQKIITANGGSPGQIIKGANSGYVTPAIVQQKDTGTSGTTFSFASNITAGNTVVAICASNFSTETVAENLGNTVTTTNLGNVLAYFFISTIPVTTGGAQTITYTNTCTSYAAFELSGIAGVDVAPVSGGAHTSPMTTPVITTTQADYALSGMVNHNLGFSGFTNTASGWTTIDNSSGNGGDLVVGSQLTSGVGSLSATWSTTNTNGGNAIPWIMALKRAPFTGQTADLQQMQTPSGTVISGVGGSGLPYKTPQTFASLPTCSSSLKGTDASVSDSTTNVAGATITGGGSTFTEAVCDGTHWLVAGGTSAGGGGGMTNPMTTAGDMITGGSSGTPQRLAAGTNTYVLTMVSGAPAWAAPTGGGINNIQITLPTSSISANTCTSYTATSMPGVLTTSTFSFTPATSTAGVTGWDDGTLYIRYYPTADTVNWKVCNSKTSSQTPGALTANVSAK